jgi:hypothetical protein
MGVGSGGAEQHARALGVALTGNGLVFAITEAVGIVLEPLKP